MTVDEIEFLALEKIFASDEQSTESPVLRIYAHNQETGTHQIIYQDLMTDWNVSVEDDEWAIECETRDHGFRCSPENIAEMKVRLKPAIQIWMRTEDNTWVVEIFRWSDFHPGQAFYPIVSDAWRESHPTMRLPN